VSGRITTYLDKGLGWTKPVVVACCRTCGTELAHHPKQHVAERAARCRRCPGCGTRGARQLAGTASPATDLAVARGWWRWPAAAGGRLTANPHPAPDWLEGGEPMPHTWLRAAEVAARLQVSPKTVTRWARQGRLPHRRTLGGHRRYDPDRIDQLLRALTYRP
jgi:excisionase family DNA binding protein